MKLTFFKPNSKNTGALFAFKFGPDGKGQDLKGDLALYVEAILQASWNPTTKSGTFKENAKNPEKRVILKLNEFEIGGLINSIKRGVESKGYHTSPGRAGHVQFSFTPSLKDGVVAGFFFSILRDGKSRFAVPISAGECETLAALLDVGLKTTFQNRFKAFQAYDKARPAAPAPVEETPAEEPAGENPFEPAPVEAPQEEDAPTENPFG